MSQSKGQMVIPTLPKILTIGVFGYSEETFFHTLQEAGVDTFCDIRRRRGVRGASYAFANSKRLQDRLAELGIQYHHLLDLAPTAEIREIQNMADELIKQLGELKNNGLIILDALILPAAVIGFWFTIEEVRKTQANPMLQLRLKTATGELKTVHECTPVDSNANENVFQELVLYNSGNVIRRWYYIIIRIPLDGFDVFVPERDKNEYWFEGIYRWLLDSEAGKYLFLKITFLGGFLSKHWRESELYELSFLQIPLHVIFIYPLKGETKNGKQGF